MQYGPLIIPNWNNTYLLDSFRLIKPYHESDAPGCVYEMKMQVLDGSTMGFARIALASKIKFENVNDNLSFSLVNKPAAYLKKILSQMYNFREDQTINVLTMQWTERDLEFHRWAMLCHWDHLVNTTPHGQSSPFKTINLPS